MSFQPLIIKNSDTLAAVALGSNLAYGGKTPGELVVAAAERLQSLSLSPIRVSRLYTTPAVDMEEGAPDFCNAVALIEPPASMTAEQLLERLLTVEGEFGRHRPKRDSTALYVPRTLDLDLIYCRGEVCNTPFLQLPHPRAMQRLFVLQPLAELWPSLLLSAQGISVSEQARKLQGQG